MFFYGRAINQEITSSKYPKTDESCLKYVQILFYYVQDSKHFIVYLPQMDGKSENFLLKLFNFSSRILETYVEATEVCFQFSYVILKVTFQLSFQFLVMVFLFLTYIIQRFINNYVKRQVLFDELKVKLVQAYVFTVLLSYQKVVMGAFTLL